MTRQFDTDFNEALRTLGTHARTMTFQFAGMVTVLDDIMAALGDNRAVPQHTLIAARAVLNTAKGGDLKSLLQASVEYEQARIPGSGEI